MFCLTALRRIFHYIELDPVVSNFNGKGVTGPHYCILGLY